MIAPGRVGVELPIDSEEADRERSRRRSSAGSAGMLKTGQQLEGDGNLLHVLKQGFVTIECIFVFVDRVITICC